ncbi:MAG: hypothetical protein ACXQS8_03750, partial [Candidatus Helarchaeales archaeon]
CGYLPTLDVYVYDNDEKLERMRKIRQIEPFVNEDEILIWMIDKVMQKVAKNDHRSILISSREFPEPEYIPDISSEVSHPEQLKPILEELGFKVFNDSEVRIMTDLALYSINLETADIFVTPLKCDACAKDCKKREMQYLCIISAGVGWTNITSLSQKDFLILSKIYALANLPYEKLPADVRSQLDRILFCKEFVPKTMEKKRLKLND